MTMLRAIHCPQYTKINNHLNISGMDEVQTGVEKHLVQIQGYMSRERAEFTLKSSGVLLLHILDS